MLIIGTGGIGKRHLKGYSQTGRAVLSIVEPDQGKRANAVRAFDIVHDYVDIADVDLSKYDLAVICSPANTHVPLMQVCAAANLAFMVEKPLAVTLDSIKETLALVRAKNLVARVGYIRRISDELLSLRDQIKSGKIGDLRLVYINGSQDFPKYRPDYQTTYYSRPEMGGGAILDGASHSFDMLIWIVGKPAEVSCMYDRLALKGTQTEDTCLINIRFESGIMANITLNQFQKPNTSRQEFIGTKGNLMLEHSTLSFMDCDAPEPTESKDYMEGLVPIEAHQARFAMQANAMLDAIEGKLCHLATLEDAHLNLRLALAAKRSWEKRIIVKLEP